MYFLCKIRCYEEEYCFVESATFLYNFKFHNIVHYYIKWEKINDHLSVVLNKTHLQF